MNARIKSKPRATQRPDSKSVIVRFTGEEWEKISRTFGGLPVNQCQFVRACVFEFVKRKASPSAVLAPTGT